MEKDWPENALLSGTYVPWKFLAERGGFEPPIGYEPIHAFQACDFNHSSTSPDGFRARLTAKPPIITRFLGCTRASWQASHADAPLDQSRLAADLYSTVNAPPTPSLMQYCHLARMTRP